MKFTKKKRKKYFFSTRLRTYNRFVTLARSRNAYWHPACTHSGHSGAWLLEFTNIQYGGDATASASTAHHDS